MLTPPDDFLFEDLHFTGFRQVHGLDDHYLEILLRNTITLKVQQELAAFHIAAVREIHTEVELDAVFRARVGLVHRLPGKLQAGIPIFHQFDLIAVRVRDPGLTGVVHAEGNIGDFHAFVL